MVRNKVTITVKVRVCFGFSGSWSLFKLADLKVNGLDKIGLGARAGTGRNLGFFYYFWVLGFKFLKVFLFFLFFFNL